MRILTWHSVASQQSRCTGCANHVSTVAGDDGWKKGLASPRDFYINKRQYN